MRCVFSTRRGIGAELIRRKEGGTSSHCGIILPGYDLVLDSQPFIGVAAHPILEWAAKHSIQRVYDMSLPDEAAAQACALAQGGKAYDWWRNIGYVMWREMGRGNNVNCEELLLLAWLAGGLTLSDRAPRPSVRLLRELAHAHGRDVTHEYRHGRD